MRAAQKGQLVEMTQTVQVRPMSSSGTETSARNQPSDNEKTTNKHKLLTGICVGQFITMTVTAAVLGSFINFHGKELERLNEKSGRMEATINGEVSTIKEQIAMIQLLATNQTTFTGDALKTQGPTLSHTIKKLEAIEDYQNNSILDNSVRLSHLQTDVFVVQNSIQTLMSVIEKLEGHYIAGNATADDHSSRIALLESEQTVKRYMISNHTQLLEKNLHDQNSSIQMINKMVMQLESNSKLNRNIVKDIEASVRLIEDNITTNAIVLQNYSSHLNDLDKEITLVNEIIDMLHNNHEQLKENMTDHKIDLFSFNNRLNKLEARTNNLETSLVDHAYRIEQIELGNLSEITLILEQNTRIAKLEDEVNKTLIEMQAFAEVSTDQTDQKSAFAIYATSTTYNSLVLRFSSPQLNIGGDYNSTTGLFTCRIRGLYVFILNLYRQYSDGVSCFIKKNDSSVAFVYAPPYSKNGIKGGSGSAVVHLNQGDTVHVGDCGGTDNIFGLTSFMGFLLQAD